MLLTGFEGYGGRSDNPSAMIAESLAGSTICGHTVEAAVLPVTMHDIRANIEALIDKHQTSVVVCLGLAPGEPMIRLEKVAINQADFNIADNSGQTVRGPLLEEGGPAAYESTLPVQTICEELLASGVPARVSYTAGTFLCNAVSYYALHYCASHYPQTRAGFIHLPYLPSQVRDVIVGKSAGQSLELEQRSDLASMSFDVQRQAIVTAIECCLNSSSVDAGLS
jgi:pyroglutamyl-peptidase